MYTNKTINKQKVKIFIKNNKSNTTILFLHGFASSNTFAKGLFKLNNKYNIVAINLYNKNKPEEIDFNKMYKVAEGVLNKLRSKNIILLAHSLGGGIQGLLQGTNKNIKHYVWMSTINPLMTNSIIFKSFKAHHDLNGPKIVKTITNIISSRVDNAKEDSSKKWISKFLDKNSIWVPVFQKTIFNEKFMHKLNNSYIATKENSTYIVGKKDTAINTKGYCEYINKLNKNPIMIGVGHNPIMGNPDAVNDVLNNLVKTKRTLFRKPVFKLFK